MAGLSCGLGSEDVLFLTGPEPGLLSSPNVSIGRSLLMTHAMRRALAGEWVLFICTSDSSLEKSPFAMPQPERGDLSAEALATEALSRIQLKYLGTDVLLRQFLAGLHVMSRAPDLLIIDDFNAFFHQGQNAPPDRDVPGRTQRTFALAINAADFLLRLRGPDQARSCSLILSVTEGALPPPLSVETTARKHWFKRRLRVDGPRGGATHLGEYSVTDSLYQEVARVRLGAASSSRTPMDLELAVMGCAAGAGAGATNGTTSPVQPSRPLYT